MEFIFITAPGPIKQRNVTNHLTLERDPPPYCTTPSRLGPSRQPSFFAPGGGKDPSCPRRLNLVSTTGVLGSPRKCQLLWVMTPP